MTRKTLNRVHVIRNLHDRKIKQADAARQLGVGTRQVKRLLFRYKTGGDVGLNSRRIGKPSNNLLNEAIRVLALGLIKDHYHDFGPTFACEKLRECHDLSLSVETVRKLMIAEDFWQPRVRKCKKHHQRRERRSRRGELVQIDGSPHKWFEERAPACTLLVFIDDATSELLHLYFVESETTEAYMTSLRDYLGEHGRPVALYSDCHSVFRVNTGEEPGLTQFGRALQTLDIVAIHAHSPQAKGRVERANLTLQDRLIKEMRLQHISDMEAGNKFLKGFMADHNKRFSVPAREAENAHRNVLHSPDELDLVFSLHHQRTISKNLEVQYKKRIFQIQTPGSGDTMQKAKLTVCESLTGEITLLYKGRRLSCKEFNRFQKAKQQQPRVDSKELNSVVTLATKLVSSTKPTPNQPWKNTPLNPENILSDSCSVPT